jgi:hypothetical protein
VDASSLIPVAFVTSAIALLWKLKVITFSKKAQEVNGIKITDIHVEIKALGWEWAFYSVFKRNKKS